MQGPDSRRYHPAFQMDT